jgi:ArsR family metal-binding transcriptional regulator
MFLESIKVLNVDMCVKQPGTFAAFTRASADIREVMPYLNSMFKTASYNHDGGSITFRNDKIEFSIIENRINVARFANRTELHERLDWVRDLINDTYDSIHELTPRYDARKPVPVLSIYALLPKTNCQSCGEKSCMAFASLLHKLEAEIENCPPLMEETYEENRLKLEKAFD